MTTIKQYTPREFTNSEREDHDSRLHPTFCKKPVPLLQKQLNLHKLEDRDYKNSRVLATVADKALADKSAIPARSTWGETYLPENPASDWAGLVEKRASKRLVNRESSPNKPRDDYDIAKSKYQNKPENKYAPEDNIYLISGIRSSDPYRTSAQRMMASEPTRECDKKRAVGGSSVNRSPRLEEDITPRVIVDSDPSRSDSVSGEEKSSTPRVNTMLSNMGYSMAASTTRFVPVYEVINAPSSPRVPGKVRGGSSITFG
jgi:hypothetical protein